MKRLKLIIVGLLLFGVPIIYASFSGDTAQPEIMPAAAETQLGEPIPGLDPDRMSRFRSGQQAFARILSPEEGLGPIFNQNSCAACHASPVAGGSIGESRINFDGAPNNDPKNVLVSKPSELVVRIGRPIGTFPNLSFDPLTRLGGPVLSRRSLNGFNKDIKCNQPGNPIPVEAIIVSFRAAQPLFGLGLIEAISDEAIMANADPRDSNRDGISGRANLVTSKRFGDTRVGRFGAQAQAGTIIDFVGEEALIHLGLTNPDFPEEVRPASGRLRCDMAPNDPEDNGTMISSLNDFITFLAPPAAKPLDASAQRGQQLFTQIGCASCHIPSLRTAAMPRNDATLANREVMLYSDLLLHDMGESLAEFVQQDDQPNPQFRTLNGEFRTQPLWGLSAKRFYLHDGRTTDLVIAITEHGGESAAARDRFLRLSARARKDLLNFLRSL